VNFVLDTNAMSETEKPRPNAGLIAWHDAQDPAHLFVTTVTLAEVRHHWASRNQIPAGSREPGSAGLSRAATGASLGPIGAAYL